MRVVPTGATLALILGFAAVQGSWTERWSPAPAVEAAADRLDAVPWVVGDWSGRAAELKAEDVAQAGLARAWDRRYTLRQATTEVSVLLMCGRAGPASVHTPEWCYGGAGYDMTAPPTLCEVTSGPGAPPAPFRVARFHKTGPAEAADLRIFWSWFDGKAWSAPETPRLRFWRSPVLYKLYVVRAISDTQESTEEDPALDFLRQFLPELNKALATGS